MICLLCKSPDPAAPLTPLPGGNVCKSCLQGLPVCANCRSKLLPQQDPDAISLQHNKKHVAWICGRPCLHQYQERE